MRQITSVNDSTNLLRHTFRILLCYGYSYHRLNGANMRVLVTGGSGYIGSHTCVQLLQMVMTSSSRQPSAQQAQRAARY